MKRRIERTPKHVCPLFSVVNEKKYRRLSSKDAQRAHDEWAKRQEAGQAKAAKTREQNKRAGKKPNFILCPTCDSKSKKLRSEMGGLQTRVCKRGHLFEVDMFFGWESNKRRIEQFDRPFFSPTGGNYNDWVQGRYKNDPQGKQDR
jgi:hypothetical protein